MPFQSEPPKTMPRRVGENEIFPQRTLVTDALAVIAHFSGQKDNLTGDQLDLLDRAKQVVEVAAEAKLAEYIRGK